MSTLALEIEYLSGVSFAAVGPDSDVPDWPPQPDRIFSALVATWAARGKRDDEARALEWLEQLPVPRIQASEAVHRTAPIAFVPPNDSRSDRQKTARGVLPALRNRQPRRFPAARPRDPVVHMYWEITERDDGNIAALQRLASDVAYVGHSASLTRCRFRRLGETVEMSGAQTPKRRIYSGRLEELRRTFEAGRRPLPGDVLIAQPASRHEQQATLFDRQWLLLEHVAGDMPDIRACAVVVKTIRDALLSGYRQIGRGHDIPEVISGHTQDGSPTRKPHLAIIPLPFAGFPHADGHVMGFALVPPRERSVLEDETFRRVLRNLAPLDEERGRRVLEIKTKEGTPSDRAFSIKLSPTLEPPAGKRSLDPALYLGPMRQWATVTPIALDRHLKEKGEGRPREIAEQIAAACRNIGLPEPESVVADKHPAIEGAVSAYPSGGSPAWMHWRLPNALASRQLTHAVIRFSSPVEGPVILCAGRFVGLGLCRPIDGRKR